MLQELRKQVYNVLILKVGLKNTKYDKFIDILNFAIKGYNCIYGMPLRSREIFNLEWLPKNEFRLEIKIFKKKHAHNFLFFKIETKQLNAKKETQKITKNYNAENEKKGGKA